MNLLDCLPTEGDRCLALLSDIADSLRTIARRERAESPQERAIKLLAERGAGNIAAIARDVGVSRATLYNSPEFREALDRVRGSGYWQLRAPNVPCPDEL